MAGNVSIRIPDYTDHLEPPSFGNPELWLRFVAACRSFEMDFHTRQTTHPRFEQGTTWVRV
jgi:hypothetical protein